MKKLKVLLIAPSSKFVGGQAVQAIRLIDELKKDPGVSIDFQPIDVPLPAWLSGIPYVRTVAGFLAYCFVMLGRVPRYDILHTFTAGLWSFALWTIPAIHIGRLFGKKVIVNYRDGRIEQHLASWPSAKCHLKRAAAIVSPSDYVVDVLARHGIPARRIYNIIDVSRFRHRKRSKLRPVFMTNRALEPLYNVGCILRAFAIVQAKYPEASLTVAHDGPCRAELEALAGELSLQNTQFIGCVPNAQISELFDAADLYLTTPNIDCMPGSILESFASGVPVLATKAGGIPYLVTHDQTGLLIDLNDHQTLAKHAIRLLEDPDLVSRLTDQAYAELERYRWSVIRQEWVGLYRELTG